MHLLLQLLPALICMELQFWMHVSKSRQGWNLLLPNIISALSQRYCVKGLGKKEKRIDMFGNCIRFLVLLFY